MFKQYSVSIYKDSYDFWIFDLDNTLYDINLGVFKKISKRITKFIVDEFQLNEDKAKVLQREMYLKCTPAGPQEFTNVFGKQS